MISGDILRGAANIVEGARNATHGEKERSFDAIAGLWNAYDAAKKDPIAPDTSFDVAWKMALLKIGRSLQGGFTRDHYVDAAGYAAIAGEIAEGAKETKRPVPEKDITWHPVRTFDRQIVPNGTLLEFIYDSRFDLSHAPEKWIWWDNLALSPSVTHWRLA